MLSHFLAPGDLIIAQIQAALPGKFALVKHAADLAGVKDSLQVTPACHVLLQRMTLAAQLRQGDAVSWGQEWLTVVVTRSAKEAKTGAGAMALAGPLVGALLRPGVLAGWRMTEGVAPLEPLAPPPPLLSTAGTLYVPLAWRVTVSDWT